MDSSYCTSVWAVEPSRITLSGKVFSDNIRRAEVENPRPASCFAAYLKANLARGITVLSKCLGVGANQEIRTSAYVLLRRTRLESARIGHVRKGVPLERHPIVGSLDMGAI